DRRGDPSHWAELVAEHGVTLWNSVPAQMQMLHDYLATEPWLELPSLRLAFLSGDWIPVALPDQVRRRLPGIELVSMGGATEAAIWSILHPIGEVAPEWRSIPYGVPLERRLVAVVAPAYRSDPLPGGRIGAELDRETRTAADAVLASLDGDRYLAYTRSLDEVALLEMLHALRTLGLFPATGASHTLE